MLKREIEGDETHLYKIMHFKKFGRPYELKVWLFVRRETEFTLIFPILKSNKKHLMEIILKHVENRCIIYTDSWSVYVNNKTNPPISNLKNLDTSIC